MANRDSEIRVTTDPLAFAPDLSAAARWWIDVPLQTSVADLASLMGAFGCTCDTDMQGGAVRLTPRPNRPARAAPNAAEIAFVLEHGRPMTKDDVEGNRDLARWARDQFKPQRRIPNADTDKATD